MVGEEGSEGDLAFAAAMVQAFNLILLTSPEVREGWGNSMLWRGDKRGLHGSKRVQRREGEALALHTAECLLMAQGTVFLVRCMQQALE